MDRLRHTSLTPQSQKLRSVPQRFLDFTAKTHAANRNLLHSARLAAVSAERRAERNINEKFSRSREKAIVRVEVIFRDLTFPLPARADHDKDVKDLGHESRLTRLRHPRQWFTNDQGKLPTLPLSLQNLHSKSTLKKVCVCQPLSSLFV